MRKRSKQTDAQQRCICIQSYIKADNSVTHQTASNRSCTVRFRGTSLWPSTHLLRWSSTLGCCFIPSLTSYHCSFYAVGNGGTVPYPRVEGTSSWLGIDWGRNGAKTRLSRDWTHTSDLAVTLIGARRWWGRFPGATKPRFCSGWRFVGSGVRNHQWGSSLAFGANTLPAIHILQSCG